MGREEVHPFSNATDRYRRVVMVAGSRGVESLIVWAEPTFGVSGEMVGGREVDDAMTMQPQPPDALTEITRLALSGRSWRRVSP